MDFVKGVLSPLLFLVFMVKNKIQARLERCEVWDAGSNIPIKIANSPCRHLWLQAVGTDHKNKVASTCGKISFHCKDSELTRHDSLQSLTVQEILRVEQLLF